MYTDEIIGVVTLRALYFEWNKNTNTDLKRKLGYVNIPELCERGQKPYTLTFTELQECWRWFILEPIFKQGLLN